MWNFNNHTKKFYNSLHGEIDKFKAVKRGITLIRGNITCTTTGICILHCGVHKLFMLALIHRDLSGYGSRLAEIAPGTFSQASFVTNL